jgi:hypothetical protein
MDIKVVSVLAGTLVGVTATVFIAWINQKTLTHRELIRDEIRLRQTLYGEFITECAKLVMDAYQHSLEKPDAFVPVYALINRIRLCASLPVLTEAELLALRITDQYFSNNLSLQELRELVGSGQADALKAFGEACRVELNAIQARL